MTNLPFTGNFKVTCIYGKKGSWKAGYHTGIDLVGVTNKIVYNVCNGIVIMAKYYGSYGNCVKVRDTKTQKIYLFAHLKSIAVRVGQGVSRTSKIGIMGNTGNSSGAHLHFEVRTKEDVYGRQENPCNYLGIPNKVGQYSSNNYQLGSSEKAIVVGGFVEVHIPIQFTGSYRGDVAQVDSNGYQFWIHKSVIKDNTIIARAEVIENKGNSIYKLKVFNEEFDYKTKYIKKVL